MTEKEKGEREKESVRKKDNIEKEKVEIREKDKERIFA